jgi:perosamine synthetase
MLKKFHFYSGSNNLSDVVLLIKYIFFGFLTNSRNVETNTKKKFNNYLGANDTYFFSSGRMALYSILQSLGIGNNDEIIIPAFTCVVVPNAIIYSGAKPVYADISLSDFNIDLKNIQSLITKKTKAIYAQHTFGRKCNMRALRRIADSHNLYLIEDSAHLFEKDQIVNSLADVTFYSTDHSKVLNSHLGGFAASKNTEITKNLNAIYKNVLYPPKLICLKIYFSFVLEYLLFNQYVYFIGRYAHAFLVKSKVIFFYKDELFITKPPIHLYPTKMPIGLMLLLGNQLKKIDTNLSHRFNVSSFFHEQFTCNNAELKKSHAMLRYSILVKDRDIIKNIFGMIDFNVWFTSVTEGRYSDFSKVNYLKGSCPNAEYACKHIINFPTHERIDISYLSKVFRKNKTKILGEIINK